MKIIIPILSLLLVSFAMNAQGADPHRNEGSAITGMISSEIKISENFNKMDKPNETITIKKVWTQDEENIKATINTLLFNAGNYNITKLDAMVSDNAMLGISRLKDETWSNSEIPINDFFESVKKRERRPYIEVPNSYDILITEGQVALARADCILYRWGIPERREINHFTFIKDNWEWKILNISWTVVDIPVNKKTYDLEVFARGYAQSWSSQRPNFVATFYTENGSLTINKGVPAVGRTAITQSTKAFMDAFPDDMVVAFDKLVKTKKGTEFHWTLTGTNTGPNGTGKKVNISGFEVWQLDQNGLIKDSKGTFDAEEYSRQIKYGVEN
ncbi:ester cyclase [Aequorivita capsosiphonis]|uniref:ester cyclase n=1 Tax=Aequorivita capsosiphonis TaxID=487317 RepID=UPI001B7FDFFF|nr:ester cyclase [Aequorivita capsosiphonis]